MNIKKPNSFARYGNDYVAPLTTIDQIVKPSGERYSSREFELMSNVENVMFGENCAGKNLLNPTLQTTTKNGVTCTNNGDGTYTVNGTVSDNEIFDIGTVYLKKGTYKINGRPNNYGGFVWIGTSNRNMDVLNAAIDENGATFTIANDSTLYVTFIFGQNTYNNAIIKPMITTDLNATYNDFEPYVKSLKQLTDSALNMDLLWTNASPTSEFAPQTISLDLSKYRAILISILSNTTYTEAIEYSFITKSDRKARAGFIPDDFREVYFNNDYEVGFGVGYSTGTGISSSRGIPYQIYGVR